MEKELIGQAWIEIQNRPNQEEKVDNGSMKIIKDLAKSFVRKLEVNQDGIVDESEFKSVIYYFINFIDPEVSFYNYNIYNMYYIFQIFQFEPKERKTPKVDNTLPESLEYHSYDQSLPICPDIPPLLVGYLNIDFTHEALSYSQIQEKNNFLKPGGRFTPSHCQPLNRVAIVIPYR